jgi:peptide chain release factor 2
VRLSPFSAKQLRHTSFAKVDVLPLLAEKETSEIKIKPEDLRIETFRASGPGGQYVNKRETAVRLTHLPSNITVACQTERLQGLNRKKAMQMLHAKLAEAREKKIKEEMVKIKGKPVEAEWGNQIRSYVLHPYKMVKDLRTDVETSDTEGVLDGELDEFIEAELKFKS